MHFSQTAGCVPLWSNSSGTAGYSRKLVLNIAMAAGGVQCCCSLLKEFLKLNPSNSLKVRQLNKLSIVAEIRRFEGGKHFPPYS